MKVCFIGTGTIAEDHFKTAIAHNLDVCGVCSRGKSSVNFSLKHGIKRSFSDPCQMIEECQPNAIFLLTPAHAYLDILSKIQKYKLPLFMEKPLALSCLEADKIRPLISDTTFVGLNRRFYHYVPQLQSILANHKKILVQALLAERKRDYVNRSIEEQSAWLTLNGIHLIDLLVFLFGNPTSLKCNESWGQLNSAPPPPFRSIVYESNKGHHIQLGVNLDSPGGWRIHGFCEGAEIQISPLERCIIRTLVETTELVGNDSNDEKVRSLKPGFYRQIATFIDGVRNPNSLPEDWVSFDSAYASMQIIENLFLN